MQNVKIVIVAALAAGCISDEVDLGAGQQSIVQDNGESLNGVRLNGVRLNGVRLNGVRLNGVRLNGVRLNGVRLNGVPLNGPTMAAVENGVAVPDAELLGSTWEGSLSDGTTLPLRIGAIDHATSPDLTIYRIDYQTTAGWRDLCDGAGALAVQGIWNYNQGTPLGGSYFANARDFTFACRGFAIAKCVELGYQPWLGRDRLLAACTRAVRADFCGDGTPYTVDGTTINLYDIAGIETDEAAWPLEARWTGQGAACIGAPAQTRFIQVAGRTPTCIASLRPCNAVAPLGLITTELPQDNP